MGTIRSKRKNDEKQAREDAKGPSLYANRVGYGETNMAERAKARLKEVKEASRVVRQQAAAREVAAGPRRDPNEVSADRRYQAEKASESARNASTEAHLSAGDNTLHAKAAAAHLRAATAHDVARHSMQFGSYAHPEAADNHRAQAQTHAEMSGSEWDESKHPRDENGKFA